MSDVQPTRSPFDLQPPAPAGPWWSTWEDALDIFYAPKAVFERRRDGRYGMVLLILIALSVGMYFLSVQVNDAIADIGFAKGMAAQAESGQSLTPEQLAATKAFAEKAKGLLVFVLPLLITLSAWLSGLLLRALGNLMGAKFSFAQATMVGILASFPSLIGGAVIGAQALILDPNTITSKYTFSTSLARFLPDDTSVIALNFAAVLDPFILWSAVLLGVGAYIVGRMEKEKAAVLAIVHTLAFALMFPR